MTTSSSRLTSLAAGFALAVTLTWGGCARAQESGPIVLPAPVLDDNLAAGDAQTAVLAGGCYWGTQGVFEHVAGVRKVVAGYSGGDRAKGLDAAESVEITYDPAAISYGRILQIFFSVVHDPTQRDRQGPDVGSEYRSDIFYANGRQHDIAAAYVAQLDKAKLFPGPIATRLDAYDDFHRVDFSQQDFLIKNPSSDYIVENDLPKIAALKRLFPTFYRENPVTY
jgi:peptide-methionine (S)-S-oxide reductase